MLEKFFNWYHIHSGCFTVIMVQFMFFSSFFLSVIRASLKDYRKEHQVCFHDDD